MSIATSIRMRQVGPCFAAEVEGVDLRQPLSAEEIVTIHAGMDEYAVLVFHDQPLTDEQHMAFTLSLGKLEDTTGNNLREPGELRIAPGFSDVSNLDTSGQVFARDDRLWLFALGNRLWHSDASFKAIPPTYSLLRACRVPSSGGNTEFADMRAAHDALPNETKAQIDDLICEHSQLYSRQQIGFFEFTEDEAERFRPVRQRLVRTHPVSGRKSLFLASHAGGIVGWPMPEARMLLRDLTEQATQPEFVYSHPWRVNDLVIWDNRQTMHRGRPFPAHEARDVRRTTLAGAGPTVAHSD